jgi:ComF family protein
MLRRPLGLYAATCHQSLFADFRTDLIVPVPLHKKRLRQRGFNQAILLGEILSQQSGIPLQRNNLQRIRWTEPQVNLSAAARPGNVKGAFAVADSGAITGKNVLLIDDVYTTGCTVSECSRVLKNAGAAGVAVLTVARAPEQGT